MKSWLLGLALVAGCSDTQNVGDRFAFQRARWGVSLGPDAGSAAATGVTIDAAGDVVAAGTFVHRVDFGGTVLDGGDTGAYFVSKRSGIGGSERWTLAKSGYGVAISGVATDAQRDVIVAGFNISDAFLLEYDANGTLVWESGVGAGSVAQPRNVAVSSSGQIYMSVSLSGTFHTPQGETLGGPYALVAFAADGTLLWGRSLPIIGRVAATSDGGVVMAGRMDHSTAIGSTMIDLTRGGDGFVAKFDGNGQFVWLQTFGDAGIQHARVQLAVDASDRVAAVLNTASGGPPSEAFFDAASVAWTSHVRDGLALELAVAMTDDVVLTAGQIHDGVIDLGDGPQIGSMYLAARDDTGALVDQRVLGDPTVASGGDAFTALATGPSGEIAFAGYVDQPIDLGGVQLGAPAAAGQTNVVIGILDPP